MSKDRDRSYGSVKLLWKHDGNNSGGAAQRLCRVRDPKWTGRLGLDSSDFEWYANLRKVWGVEKAQKFLEGLKKQDLRLVQVRA